MLWSLASRQQKQLGMSLDDLPSEAQEKIQRSMKGITLRMGVFLGLHALLATWAAFNWSTASWALLKGVGFTISLIIYLGLEALGMRWQARRSLRPPHNATYRFSF